MKLENLHISEADLSRRDFLRRTGGGMVGLLTSGGIDLDTAKVLASPGQGDKRILLKVMPRWVTKGFGSMAPGEYVNVEERFENVAKSLPLLKKLIGRDANILSGKGAYGGYSYNVDISSSDLAKVVSQYDISNTFNRGMLSTGVVANDPGKMLELDTEGAPARMTVSITDKSSAVPNMNRSENILRDFWNSEGVDNTEPISDEFFRLLQKNGVDPTKRVWNSDIDSNLPQRLIHQRKELLRKKMLENPEKYGNISKYGMTKADMVDPEAEPEELEQYDVPADYKLASPMHQPFESRLLRALYALV